MFFRKKLLSPIEEQRLMKAIKDAELMTSGEIRIHIEAICKEDPLDACKKKFEQLQMHQKYDYQEIFSKIMVTWRVRSLRMVAMRIFLLSVMNSSKYFVN